MERFLCRRTRVHRARAQAAVTSPGLDDGRLRGVSRPSTRCARAEVSVKLREGGPAWPARDGRQRSDAPIIASFGENRYPGEAGPPNVPVTPFTGEAVPVREGPYGTPVDDDAAGGGPARASRARPSSGLSAAATARTPMPGIRRARGAPLPGFTLRSWRPERTIDPRKREKVGPGTSSAPIVIRSRRPIAHGPYTPRWSRCRIPRRRKLRGGSALPRIGAAGRRVGSTRRPARNGDVPAGARGGRGRPGLAPSRTPEGGPVEGKFSASYICDYNPSSLSLAVDRPPRCGAAVRRPYARAGELHEQDGHDSTARARRPAQPAQPGQPGQGEAGGANGVNASAASADISRGIHTADPRRPGLVRRSRGEGSRRAGPRRNPSRRLRAVLIRGDGAAFGSRSFSSVRGCLPSDTRRRAAA
jgi:hypothetical protein